MQLFPYDPDAFLPLLQELDQWKLRLDYRGPLPRSWAGRMRKELEAQAVAASTRMEGVPVTVDEVRRILAGDAPPEVPPGDRELVEGYREAMNFVFRRADDSAFRWTRELIAAPHDRVLAGRHSEGAGRLRTDAPAFVVNRLTGEQVFLPPPGERVPALVDEACLRMEEGHAHPALAAAWIHVALAAIHPFRKRPEFTSLEEWWGRHLPDYYETFRVLGREFDRDAEVTPFIGAYIEAQLHQIRALDNREKVERQIWTALEELAEDAHLDRRVANALWDAFFGRDVTAGYYRSLTDVSPATATKDLAAAVSARLLKAEGQRRGRRYVATEHLYQLLGGVLLIEAPGPPEAARGRIVAELSTRLTWSGEAFGLKEAERD
jgi:Fic family protein